MVQRLWVLGTVLLALIARAQGLPPLLESLGAAPALTGTVPGTVRGDLDPTSGLACGSGRLIERVTFQASSQQQVTLELSSQEFDTLLIAVDSHWQVLGANDDRASDTTDSALSFIAPEDGTYTALVTSYYAGRLGSYLLQLDTHTLPPPPPLPPQFASLADPPQMPPAPLVLGHPLSESLQAEDSQSPGGRFMDHYTFRAQAGQTVTATVLSSDFDPVLALLAPGRRPLAFNDDLAPNLSTNAQLWATLPQEGTYTLVVSALNPGEGGRYQIAAQEGFPELAQLLLSSDQPVQFTTCQTLPGELVPGGITHQRGQRTGAAQPYVQLHPLVGRADELVRLQLTSVDFDTFLILLDPAGNEVDSNDDVIGPPDPDLPPLDSNSRLEVVLPLSGTYTIVVTSFSPGETGRYWLDIVR